MTFTAQQISQILSGELIGNPLAEVSDVSPIEHSIAGTLSFIHEEKFLACLSAAEASVVLVTKSLLPDPQSVDTSATIILVDNARGAMAQLLSVVATSMNPRRTGVEQPVFVTEGFAIPASAYVGAFCYIGRNVKLGSGVQLYPQCYIGDNVSIGDNTVLYAGVKIYHDCVVGADCILHSGVVIGADGFGFEPDAEGVNRKIEQIGNVVIEDDVEIGANTTVDRAMMGSTVIKRNAKIDNLVQVAHNVQIGESSFLCAQVGIAGSTEIGSHCILAGQVGVAGHLKITDNCIFGAQSGVPSSVRKAGTYQGYPAIDAAKWRRAVVGFKHLPEMMQVLNRLETQQS